MRAENYVDEYLKGYCGCRDGFEGADSMVLLGAAQLWEAGQDEKYLAFLEGCLRQCVEEDGSCRIKGEKEPGLETMGLGRILFFMLDKTGEEKYRRAIDHLMEILEKQPRDKNGSFVSSGSNAGQIRPEDLFAVQPFYMEYETRFNRKERYGDIIGQFDNAQKLMYNKEQGLYLAALVDTMAGMSIQIFEQYKRLESIFKQVLGGMLKHRDEESGIFYRTAEEGEVSEKSPDVSGSLLTAYAVLKACMMGILIREKYEHFGVEILEGLPEGRHSPDRETPPSPEEAGAFMMAYGQYLLLKKKME